MGRKFFDKRRKYLSAIRSIDQKEGAEFFGWSVSSIQMAHDIWTHYQSWPKETNYCSCLSTNLPMIFIAFFINIVS